MSTVPANMKNCILGPIGKAFAGAARTFDRMDVFPMNVIAGAAVLALLMQLAACALLFVTYRNDISVVSRTAYICLTLARGLFDGGLRLLSLGCVSAVLADIMLRSYR